MRSRSRRRGSDLREWLLLVLLFTLDSASAGLAMGMLLVGMGVGTFQTPNTTSILADVAPTRRGIANGIRSMAQNSGMLVGTAVSLVVLTGQLPAALRGDVYAGTLSHLSADRRDSLVLGGRYLLLAMLAAVVASMVLSSTRGRAVSVAELDRTAALPAPEMPTGPTTTASVACLKFIYA